MRYLIPVSFRQTKTVLVKRYYLITTFDKADVIVSFGADFLGTWISPELSSTRQYVQNTE